MKVLKTKLNYSSLFSPLNIETLTLNESIPFDIYIKRSEEFVIIIEAGTILSEALYAKLKNQHNLYISKDDDEKQILSCESLKYYIRYNKDNHQIRVNYFYQVNEQLFDLYLTNKDDKLNLECVELIVHSILYIIKYDETFLKNTMPFLKNDHSIENHSLHVCLYALSLGYSIKLSDADLLKLGIAALLHDVGLKKIDDSIKNKMGILTPEEKKIIQKHSQLSVDIMKHNKISDPYIIDAVMHHHERIDGSGYPNKLVDTEINIFASILGICDVFDALTNNRPHRQNYSSFNALKMMMRDTEMVNGFNQKYLHIFLKSFL